MSASLNSGIRVLLVDDHKSVLWGLQKLIDGEKPKMEVVGMATCRAEALSAAERHSPDVVVLDLDLGDENGLDVITPLRARCSSKVIILTGLRDSTVHENAIMQGASGLIHKSESAEVILEAITRVHAGELWMDPKTISRVFSILSGPEQLRHASRACASALTGRERWVVGEVVKHRGAPAKVIADDMHISGHTLRNHLASIYGKLGIHRRLDLVLYAMEHGLDKQT
jgi:DNA-binding NarL/FixJ family response regulator